MMKKLGWVMDDGFGEIDMSTPVTIDGIAKSAKRGGAGVSRGTRLSRHKQIHFMQTFMAAPFIPCYSNAYGGGGASAAAAGGGFSLQRLFPLFNTQNFFATLLAQFNLHKFLLSSFDHNKQHTLAHSFNQLLDKSLYALSFSSELLLTPDDTLLLALEASGDSATPPRKKAVFHHKFSNHNFTAEALSPALFVDNSATFWDLPFSMAIDLASLPSSDSGASYHFSINQNSNSPKHFQAHHHQPPLPPPSLLPGLSIKTAFSYKNTASIWASQANKLKMVQPYDIFLSNSHLSLSGIIGAVITASLGDNYVTPQLQNEYDGFKGLRVHHDSTKTALLTDMFASASCTAQYGNFQRLAMDLTRFYARLDFPSCSKFLSAATRVAQDLHNSQKPSIEAIRAMCPNATLSLQQQIVGPFSFRVDSGVGVDLKNKGINVNQPVFAIEYAIQVLGSAKAVAWYSPMQKEFMVELRFFET